MKLANCAPALLCLSLLLGLVSNQSRASIYNPLAHMWYGTRDIVHDDSGIDTQNAVLLAVGLSATLGALSLDSTVSNHFNRNNRLEGAEKIGNFWGTGFPSAAIALGQIGVGLFACCRNQLDAGAAHGEALVANFIFTTALKYSIQRPRPGDGTHNSMPSGHTSTAFTTAGSLWDFYGPWVGGVAVAMGAFTGVSRLATNAHHLSDVIAGATLGFIVGHSYAKHHLAAIAEREKENKVAWHVTPYFDDRSDFGISAEFRF